MKLPKDVDISNMKITLTQDEDSCGEIDSPCQVLEVEFQDAGGGFYYILKTERWAVDSDKSLFEDLDNICKELDNNFKVEKDADNG
jgi:hypothetical protein